MKLLFSYTGPLIKDRDGNYYSRTITDELLSRYGVIADEITMLTRVRVVSNKEELRKYSKINNKNFSVIECPNLASLKGLLFNINVAKRIIVKAVYEAEKVIIRLPCIMGSIVANEAKRQKKQYLIEVVGCPWDSLWNHSNKGKIIAPYLWRNTRKVINKAPYVLYVTNEFLQRRYPSKGKTMGCSDVVIPTTKIEVLEQRLTKIKKKTFNSPIILGTTAALDVRYKGQEYVIAAIAKLNKAGKNYEYHLAGGGSKSYLESMAMKFGISDKVKFLGSLPHEQVFDYLDNIDIYIQPSKTEGLPRALIEAMSRGCPTLGSSTGGIPELVNEKFLFNIGSVDEITRLLEEMDSEMTEEVNRSFETAKKYDKNLLQEMRNTFYEDFIKALGIIND
ncbi:glycosyltransferase [Fictibacillus sp. UD]|uniref:glycosyltransferase n=1 Tax=Fictibacillus sp. UD TaxID=3038777 RepID=UPI003747642E